MKAEIEKSMLVITAETMTDRVALEKWVTNNQYEEINITTRWICKNECHKSFYRPSSNAICPDCKAPW